MLVWLIVRPLLIQTHAAFRTWCTRLRSLLGEYTELFVAAAAVAFKSQEGAGDNDKGDYTYHYDLGPSERAIETLCAIVTPLTSNLLQLLLEKPDVEAEVGYSYNDWYAGSEYETLRFDGIRKLIEHELDARDQPAYDPDHYRNGQLWVRCDHERGEQWHV